MSRPWRLLALTAVLGIAVCGILAARYGLAARPSDTDDAMRLYLVRDLLAGRGWYDQWIARLQPPQGVFLHWSRLLDGGLAAMMSLLRLVMPPSAADLATRIAWPFLWLFPAIGCALIVARNLGGRSAVLLTAPLLLVDIELYRQFIPGRVDHHDVQIVMAMAAFACALAPGRRTLWAAVGGVAAGLGLAIGLEALAMQALVGASFALALARDRKAAGPAGAYGLGLAVASSGLFLLQTPPDRWSLSFCDALALNLVAGLVVAGAGLCLTAVLAGRAPAWGRLALLAGTAVASGGVYLALDPMCIHGPFAAMNPAVRPFWFDRIQEVQSLATMLKRERGPALVAVVTNLLALAGAALLVAREWRAPRTSVILAAAMMIAAVVVGYFSWRMQDYVFWVGIPLLGAALSRVAERRLGDLMIPSVIASLLVSPAIVGGAVAAIANVEAPPKKGGGNPYAFEVCFDPRAYRQLAALPAGVVLSHADLGPFILIYSSQSPVAAPYHRMADAILAVHDAFNASPAVAEAAVRKLDAAYVVDCPAYPMIAAAGSFGDRLHRGEVPAWLEPLSGPKATLAIFRVRPAAPS